MSYFLILAACWLTASALVCGGWKLGNSEKSAERLFGAFAITMGIALFSFAPFMTEML